jgi:hypothetical protein
MLEEVRITGLGVIDDAVLELSPGFNVVTGETGAGKTMVVSGLGLLFGGRADPARVRPGAERASVDGRLRVDPDGGVARQVNEAGGVVRDRVQRAGAVASVAAAAEAEGLGVRGIVASPLPGPSGNVEYFLWLRRGAPPLDAAALGHAIEAGPQ